MSVRNVVCRGYRYAKCGKPSQVMKSEEWITPFDRSSDKAVVRMIAAPVHHHDKWMMLGQCGSLKPPAFPAVAGTEGVGEVEEVGAQCTTVKPGDYVVFNRQDVGTWATNVVAPEAALDRVPSDIEPEHLSMMGVYGTAWRLVHDFGRVKPGDVVWVIGRGAVATATACLLQQRGVTAVIVMRGGGRPNEEATHRALRQHLPNATTIKGELLQQRCMHMVTRDLPRPKLIFNGIGGPLLQESLRFAAEGCKVVSFGNMSRLPLSVSVGRHLFQGIQLLNFWYGRWLQRSTREEREAMYAKICDLMRTGAHGNPHGSELQRRARFFAFAERYHFDTQFHEAYNNAFAMFTSRKPVLRFGEPHEWTHSGEWHKEHELAQSSSNQYLEGIGQIADRSLQEYQAMEFGGAALADELGAVFDTEGSREFRAAYNVPSYNMTVDHESVMHDTARRYLETESQIYNFRYHIRGHKDHRRMHAPGITPGFYPDDDPYYANTLGTPGSHRKGPADYTRAHEVH